MNCTVAFVRNCRVLLLVSDEINADIWRRCTLVEDQISFRSQDHNVFGKTFARMFLDGERVPVILSTVPHSVQL